MKKGFFGLVLVGILAFGMVVVGCDNDNGNDGGPNRPAALIGQWGTGDTVMIEFTSAELISGTGAAATRAPWRVSGNAIQIESSGHWVDMFTAWSIDGDTLTLTMPGGIEVPYTRIN